MMEAMKVDIRRLLVEKGLRATRQRVALLTVLSLHHALSVEAIVKKGRQAFDTATAYRMLDAFEQAGLVVKSGPVDGKALYELSRGHHHHAVCRKCGTVRDVSACVPKALTRAARKASGFASIENHRLEFSGVCTSCAK